MGNMPAFYSTERDPIGLKAQVVGVSFSRESGEDSRKIALLKKNRCKSRTSGRAKMLLYFGNKVAELSIALLPTQMCERHSRPRMRQSIRMYHYYTIT